MVENSLRDKRILVVDDEPQLRRMIVDVLRAEGFCAISQAGSVMEALAVFRETNPQLALLDVMLPDGDGFTLCEYLRSLSAGAPLPVMFLTAKNETEDRLAGLRTGADDYIPKPFSPQELVLRVCAVLRRCYPAQPDTLQLAACTLDLSNAEAIRPNGERRERARYSHGARAQCEPYCHERGAMRSRLGRQLRVWAIAHDARTPHSRENRGRPLASRITRNGEGPWI